MITDRETYRIYYDTPNGRPHKTFEQRHEAIEYAQGRMDRAPEVVAVREVTIWDRGVDTK